MSISDEPESVVPAAIVSASVCKVHAWFAQCVTLRLLFVLSLYEIIGKPSAPIASDDSAPTAATKPSTLLTVEAEQRMFKQRATITSKFVPS